MVDKTINAEPRTIRLKGVGTRMEKSTLTTITPGMLITPNGTDHVIPHNVAAANTAAIFALENELLGKGIDDNYVTGDYVQAEHFSGGDWVLAILDASATAIVEGDLLQSAGDGSLEIVTSSYGNAIAMAMESVDNSSGITIARIKVAIL
jgi:hypothetical protein